MLLLEEKYTEALEAYEASLKISANRFRSLYGAARAAELAGRKDRASSYYRKLLEVTAGHSVDRPEVRQAGTFLEKTYCSGNNIGYTWSVEEGFDQPPVSFNFKKVVLHPRL